MRRENGCWRVRSLCEIQKPASLEARALSLVMPRAESEFGPPASSFSSCSQTPTRHAPEMPDSTPTAQYVKIARSVPLIAAIIAPLVRLRSQQRPLSDTGAGQTRLSSRIPSRSCSVGRLPCSTSPLSVRDGSFYLMAVLTQILWRPSRSRSSRSVSELAPLAPTWTGAHSHRPA